MLEKASLMLPLCLRVTVNVAYFPPRSVFQVLLLYFHLSGLFNEQQNYAYLAWLLSIRYSWYLSRLGTEL